MSQAAIITLILLCVDILLYLTNWVQAEVVALGTILLLRLSGVLTITETFSGFGSQASITIMAVFILTTALQRSGLSHQVSVSLMRWAKGNTPRLVFLIMTAAAFFSLFMNNVAAAAIFLPVVREISSESKISLSRLLIPMAYGTILGGMATYFTTSNILVSNVLQQYNLPSFGVFSFIAVGGIAATLGILFMSLIGWRSLPEQSSMHEISKKAWSHQELSELYHLRERLWELYLGDQSKLLGRTLSESQIGETYGVSVLAIQRNQHLILAPNSTTTVGKGDTLIVLGRQDRVEQLAQSNELQIHSAHDWQQSFHSEDIDLFEVVVAPRASIAGKSLKELHFREKYDLSAVALWRENRIYRTDVGEKPLRFGDALLMLGKKDRAQLLQSDPDFLLLTAVIPTIQPPWKLVVTALALLFAIGTSATGLLLVAEAMFLAALVLILTRVITMEEAYQSIEWRVIFIVAGLLPLGIAMTKSGLTAQISHMMLAQVGHFGALPLLFGFWGLATLFTQVVSGQTTAVVFSPLAISTALELQLNPQAFAMAIAIGSSTAFLTPISHSVNLFIMGVGGYQFRDFLKVGIPITILVGIVILLFLPLFYPLPQ